MGLYWPAYAATGMARGAPSAEGPLVRETVSEGVPSTTRGAESRSGGTRFVERSLVRLGITGRTARFALLVFVLSRVAFVVVTLFVVRTYQHSGGPANFVDAWARYDATFYARLAHDGYQGGRVLYRAAFFPLQVILTALTAPLAAGNTYVSAILVANISFFVALLGMGSLARSDADELAARRAMVYLTLFPTAFFLFAGYAESLFLALAIWCVVCCRRGLWWQAGALGLLAAATRQMGLFLVLPFAYEYARHAGWRLRRVRFDALAILLIPCGLLLFMFWLWRTTSDPLAFSHAENYWQHTLTPPWAVFSKAARSWWSHDRIFTFRDAVDILGLAAIATTLIFGARGPRAIRPGEWAYAAAVWLLVVVYPAADWVLQSDARYMLIEFPCFLWIARQPWPRWAHITLLVISAALLFVMTQYFLRGKVII